MKKQAFTLVELIVSITILAILGTIAFISMQSYSEQSRDSVRISDISTIKKGLSLYEVESGKYPDPTNGVNITYSGVTVWTQGTYGNTMGVNVDKLDKIPKDPLIEKEYTYSVTLNKREYNLGGILEGDEIVLRNNLLGETNAGETTTNALVTGTYNGKILKTLSGTKCSVLALPTIITNDTNASTDLIQILNSQSLVYNGYQNLPSSFIGSKFKTDGGFDYEPSKFLVYNDVIGCSSLSQSETERIGLLKNLQDNYSGTILKENVDYTEIINTDINLFSPNNATKLISRAIVGNNLSLKLNEDSLTFLNCETGLINGYTYGNVAHGLGENVTKEEITSHGIKNYGAQAVCNNGNIEIANENINIICDGGYVEQGGMCVQDVCNGTIPTNAYSTATSQNVSTPWTYNTTAGICTFKCDLNYTWNTISKKCESDTKNTNCTSLPTNAQWNTTNNIDQTWNGTTWLPLEIGNYNTTPSTTECNFKCDAHYTWNGSECIADTQTGTCGGIVVTNATAITGNTYTQTWNGTTWSPITNWGENQATCDFDCNPNYTWNSTSCTANNYTVTFDGNGGSGHSPTTKSIAYNTALGTLPTNPTNAGYTFDGWFTATTGGLQVTTGTLVTGNATVYAQWSINSYTVTFDGNGGTGHTPATKSVVYNTAVGTLATNPTKTGYTFTGWFTATTGGLQVTTGTLVTGNATVYAQWTINSYTVTFDGNGGTGHTPTTMSIVYNTAIGTLPTNPTKTGYTFTGWFTALTGGSQVVPATLVTGNATVYAQWTANNNTITFNGNTSTSGTMSGQTIATDASANLTSNAFVKTGYTFAGWSTTVGGAVEYTNGASYTMGTSGVTLYAKWTANNNTITFNGNTNTSGAMSNQTIATAASANLTTNLFLKTGYTFTGWATTSTGSVAYANGASYTMGTSDVTLYAKWIINTYTVSGSFGANANGATINVCGTNVTADSSGNFTATRDYGSVCNTITATRTNYTCTTTTNGPASLSSNATTIAGNCAISTCVFDSGTFDNCVFGL